MNLFSSRSLPCSTLRRFSPQRVATTIWSVDLFCTTCSICLKNQILFSALHPQLQREYSTLKTNPSLSLEKGGISLARKQEKEELFSIDQIRQGESPWTVYSETVEKEKIQKERVQIANKSRLAHSFFKKRLQERRKIRVLYGHLSGKALSRVLRQITKPQELISVLERRLDVVLKRASFFSSIQSARQSIVHAQICVNRRIVHSPAYQCQAGDLIQVIQKQAVKRLKKGPRRANNSLSLRTTSCTDRLQERKHKHSSKRFVQCLFECAQLLQNKVCLLSDLKNTEIVLSDFVSRQRSSCATHFQSRGLKRTKVFLENKSRSLSPFKESKQSEWSKQSWQVDVTSTKLHTTKELVRDETPNRTDRDLYAKQSRAHRQEPQIGVDDLFAFSESTHKDRKIEALASSSLHLEISHRSLSVIFLYPPQRVCLSVLLDIHAAM